MQRATGILILALVSCVARAECEPPGAPLEVKLPAELIEARYKDYLRMCELHGGTLVDGQSKRMGKRFRRSSGGHRQRVKPGSPEPEKPKSSGPVFVGVVIDESGKIISVSLIGTSGDPVNDRKAMDTMWRTSYAWPARLDKKPVKSYESFLVVSVNCPTCENL